MNFASILTFLEGAAATVTALGIPTVSAGSALADIFLKIAQAAVNAHVAVTGQPLDLNLLKPIEKVP